MEIYWHSWMWIAVAVPIFYALDSVLDVFFVGRNIYRNPMHATVLTGLFAVCFVLILCFRFDLFILPKAKYLIILITNGMLYMAYIYFYFKTLFKLNDASNLECFLGFSVILVPLFAFVFLGEKLAPFQYFGIAIALLGVIALTRVSIAKTSFKKSFSTMSIAVIILSLTFVIQDEMYQHVNFYTGLVLFLTGQVLASLVLWNVCRCKHILSDTYAFGPLFIFSQILGVLAVIFSQRAIDISPSVTIVVAIETTTPLFIMLFSFLAIVVISGNAGRENLTISILQLQLRKMPYKIIAFSCLLTGILFTSFPDLIAQYVDSNFYAITDKLD